MRRPARCCGPTIRRSPRNGRAWRAAGRSAAGLAAWHGKIIIAALDGRLIALDAKTGKPVWTAQTLDKGQPLSLTGAPRIAAGQVIIGNAGGDFGARGYISA